MASEQIVNVRYMVDDVAAAVDFYTTHLGFEVHTNFPPAFADVVRGNLRVLLSGPKSSAGRPMPDGARPGHAVVRAFWIRCGVSWDRRQLGSR